jgi:NAD(P)-dependent dehydrogenase (short-subunit alcohol dehydrogenase family)
MDIHGRTALVTGAAQGIGRLICRELARRGARVIGIDVPGADFAETLAMVEQAGRSFDHRECDVTDRQAVKDAIASCAEDGFDIVVNNAGILPSGPFVERSYEIWQRAIDVNLSGTLAICYETVPHLLRRKRGHIINIASIAGKIGSPGIVAYCASKHGVVGLSAALRFELAGSGVDVSCVIPAMVNTRLSHGVRRSPLVPIIEPEIVARGVIRAVEKNTAEMYLPGRARLMMGVVPTLVPPLYRWLVRKDPTGWGWMTARKPVYGVEE